MRRREFILLGCAAVAQPLAVRAQQALNPQQKKSYRVGFLFAGTLAVRPQAQAFWKTLHGLGYVEGKNLIIEVREARGELDRLPKLASELVDTRPDVIVAVTTPAVAAVQRSTHTVPIVMAVVLDPVGSGFAKSLAYPGSNITGPSGYLGDLTGKRIQLFKELLPELSILGILWNKGNYISTRVVQSAVEVASPLGISLKSLPIQAPAELASLLDRASKENLNGLFVAGDPLLFDRRADIIAFSIANRIPTFHTWPDEAVDGAFAAYGYRLSDDYRRAAYYVDKILKGAAPSELPIDQPTRFELVLNIKTAKSIGVAIPLSVLSTADELIN
jgi:putative tryptophan/tyrosine transport system substrate-binding protein